MNPIAFTALHWPDIRLYGKQREVLLSLEKNDETVVVAGNELGKDFVASIAILWFFMTRHPCRIVTTSAKEDHLRVLWGEIHQRIRTSAYPLDSTLRGWPVSIVMLTRELRKLVKGQECPLSYVKGMVASAESEAAMQGHHVAHRPNTMFVCDEASSVPHRYHRLASTWAHRMFIFGNPWPCDNFFYHAVEGRPGTEDRGGDVPDPNHPGRYYRKVIHIGAEDSPNVRFGQAQSLKGHVPTDKILVPGVIPYNEYVKRLELWDDMQKEVSLFGKFYKGKGIFMFPADWLTHSADLAQKLTGQRRWATGIGVDPAEGGDSTALAAADEQGIIAVYSEKTPDTSKIPQLVMDFARNHGAAPECITFDRGGGGYEHINLMRQLGYPVRAVGFGETVKLPLHTGITLLEERRALEEERYAAVTMRDRLYSRLRSLMDPTSPSGGYAIPDTSEGLNELRRQLSLIPLTRTSEGRVKLLPKRAVGPNADRQQCLERIIGRSPDEADAAVLAVHAVFSEEHITRTAGLL